MERLHWAILTKMAHLYRKAGKIGSQILSMRIYPDER